MSSTYQIHVMFLQESRNNIRSKSERNTTIVFWPSGNVFVRIWPKQIAKKTTIWNLYTVSISWIRKLSAYIGWSHNSSYLFHWIEIRTQTTMHGKNLFVNDRSNWQAVEAISESLPKFDIVTSFAFIVEAINSVDWCAFMISSENEEIFWILDLVCKKKTDGLERLLASINVIA